MKANSELAWQAKTCLFITSLIGCQATPKHRVQALVCPSFCPCDHRHKPELHALTARRFWVCVLFYRQCARLKAQASQPESGSGEKLAGEIDRLHRVI